MRTFSSWVLLWNCQKKVYKYLLNIKNTQNNKRKIINKSNKLHKTGQLKRGKSRDYNFYLRLMQNAYLCKIIERVIKFNFFINNNTNS